MAHFKKNKTIKCSSYFVSYFYKVMSQQGRISLGVISTSQFAWGTCFPMPPGCITFPFVKDMVWHSEAGRQFEVPL